MPVPPIQSHDLFDFDGIQVPQRTHILLELSYIIAIEALQRHSTLIIRMYSIPDFPTRCKLALLVATAAKTVTTSSHESPLLTIHEKGDDFFFVVTPIPPGPDDHCY